MLDIGDDLDAMNQAYGDIYVPATASSSAYDTSAYIETFGVPTVLVASRSTPSEEAYQLTKTIFEHMDELRSIHPAAADITAESAMHTRGIELLPGPSLPGGDPAVAPRRASSSALFALSH